MHIGYYCAGPGDYDKYWQGCDAGECKDEKIMTCPSSYYCDGAVDRRQYYCSLGECTNRWVETCSDAGYYYTAGDNLKNLDGCSAGSCVNELIETCTTAYFCSATNLYKGEGCDRDPFDACVSDLKDTCDDYYCTPGDDRRLKTGCEGTNCTTEFTEACVKRVSITTLSFI